LGELQNDLPYHRLDRTDLLVSVDLIEQEGPADHQFVQRPRA
jgi:hypothetical protein